MDSDEETAPLLNERVALVIEDEDFIVQEAL